MCSRRSGRSGGPSSSRGSQPHAACDVPAVGAGQGGGTPTRGPHTRVRRGSLKIICGRVPCTDPGPTQAPQCHAVPRGASGGFHTPTRPSLDISDLTLALLLWACPHWWSGCTGTLPRSLSRRVTPRECPERGRLRATEDRRLSLPQENDLAEEPAAPHESFQGSERKDVEGSPQGAGPHRRPLHEAHRSPTALGEPALCPQPHLLSKTERRKDVKGSPRPAHTRFKEIKGGSESHGGRGTGRSPSAVILCTAACQRAAPRPDRRSTTPSRGRSAGCLSSG